MYVNIFDVFHNMTLSTLLINNFSHIFFFLLFFLILFSKNMTSSILLKTKKKILPHFLVFVFSYDLWFLLTQPVTLPSSNRDVWCLTSSYDILRRHQWCYWLLLCTNVNNKNWLGKDIIASWVFKVKIRYVDIFNYFH